MYPTLYRTARLFYRHGFEKRRIFNQLLRTQWLSRAELEEYKLSQLKKLVAYAYEHVPYYHERYSNMDIHPQDLKTLPMPSTRHWRLRWQ